MHRRIKIHIDGILNFISNPKINIEYEKVFALYSTGISDNKIAKILGVSNSWVFKWRKEKKLKLNYLVGGNPRPEGFKKMKNLYNNEVESSISH